MDTIFQLLFCQVRLRWFINYLRQAVILSTGFNNESSYVNKLTTVTAVISENKSHNKL